MKGKKKKKKLSKPNKSTPRKKIGLPSKTFSLEEGHKKLPRSFLNPCFYICYLPLPKYGP